MSISQVNRISFVKFQGVGNDFIIIDDLKQVFPHDKELIRRLCHRQFGVGADGLILVQPSYVAEYKMRIFNADGLEALMCGNGLRCLVGYLCQCLGREEKQFQIESLKGVHLCYREGDEIRTCFGRPVIKELSKTLNQEEGFHIIDTGVPHAVRFMDDLEDHSFENKGRLIRYHPAFSPEGVNVNFACIDEEAKVTVRTYERGVEGETLGCGTGAAAVAVAAKLMYGLRSPVHIMLKKSKEKLLCYLEEAQGEIVKVSLRGAAKYVFHGQVDLDQL